MLVPSKVFSLASLPVSQACQLGAESEFPSFGREKWQRLGPVLACLPACLPATLQMGRAQEGACAGLRAVNSPTWGVWPGPPSGHEAPGPQPRHATPADRHGPGTSVESLRSSRGKSSKQLAGCDINLPTPRHAVATCPKNATLWVKHFLVVTQAEAPSGSG